MIDAGVAELAAIVPTAAACRLSGKPRASHYRQQHPTVPAQRGPRPPRPLRAAPPNALSDAERQQVLQVLKRAATLYAAYAANPTRFGQRRPQPPRLRSGAAGRRGPGDAAAGRPGLPDHACVGRAHRRGVAAQSARGLPDHRAARGRGPREPTADGGRKLVTLTPQGREHVEERRQAWGDPFGGLLGTDAGPDLRGPLRELHAAAKQVMVRGDRAQSEAAVKVIADARRALYLVLAEVPEGTDG